MCGVRRAVARLLVVGVLTSSAGALTALAVPTTAIAASTYSMESEFIGKMNAAREANGLHPYSVASDLTSVARGHSQQMATRQSLYHNPNLTTDVHDWQAVGENVGDGPTVDGLHTAFMNSPEHRANILDHDFTQVGVGVVVDGNGIIWVTVDFREPMTSTPAPTPSTTRHTPTHRTTARHTTTHHTTAPTAVADPAPGRRTVSTPHAVAHASPGVSARELLLRRLRAVRSAPPPARPVDAVAQAVDFVSTLARLAG